MVEVVSTVGFWGISVWREGVREKVERPDSGSRYKKAAGRSGE